MKEEIFKKGIKRKLFSVVLALAMVISFMPMNCINVFAAAPDTSSWPTSMSHTGCEHPDNDHFYSSGTTYSFNGSTCVEGRGFIQEIEDYFDHYDGGSYGHRLASTFVSGTSAGWYYQDGVTWMPCGAAHDHDFTYSLVTTAATNDTIKAICGNSDGKCGLTGDKSVTLTLSASSANYSGSTVYSGAKIADADGTEIKAENATNKWSVAGLAIPTIKYYKAASAGSTEGSEEVTNLIGLAEGYYYAAVTVGTAGNEKTAKAAFTIGNPTWPKTIHSDGCSNPTFSHFYYTGNMYTIDSVVCVEGRFFSNRGVSYDSYQYNGVQKVLLSNFISDATPGWYYLDGTTYKACMPLHTWEYSANGATLTATCKKECGEETAHTATLTLTASSANYSGIDNLSTFNTATGNTISENDVKIYKVKTEGATTGGDLVQGTPSEEGYYYASLTVDTATAVKAFTIGHPTWPQTVHNKYVCANPDGSHFWYSGNTYQVDSDTYLEGIKFVNGERQICDKDHTHYYNADIAANGAGWYDNNGKNCELIFVSEINVDKYDLSLIEGQTETLVATVLPENATDKSVTWSSGDESVATVDQNGKVTAVSVGYTRILVKANDIMDEGTAIGVTVLPKDYVNVSTYKVGDIVKNGEYVGSESSFYMFYVLGDSPKCFFSTRGDDAEGFITYPVGKDGTGRYAVKMSAEYTVIEDPRTDDPASGESGNGSIIDSYIGTETTPVTKIYDMDVENDISLTDEEKAKVEAGNNFTVGLIVFDREAKEDFSAAFEAVATESGLTIGKYIDITMVLSCEGHGSRDITKTNNEVTLSVKLPAEMIDANANRTYYVIRDHEGEKAILPAAYNEETGIIYFSSNLFSTYAIAYIDREENNEIIPPAEGKDPVEEEPVKEIVTIPVYRVYNPNSGLHFYTVSEFEKDYLVSLGWNEEGIDFYAPEYGAAVYRAYNPANGDHYFTTSKAEIDALVANGWNDEGLAWYSDGELSVYKVKNPNAKKGQYFYTSNKKEYEYLVSLGWEDLGVAWKSMLTW